MGKRVSEMTPEEHAIALARDAARRPGRNELLVRQRREKRAALKAINPELVARRYKNDHLRSAYGLTLAEYEQMVAQQNGCCAICEVKMEGRGARKACPDHQHVANYRALSQSEKKKLVRGILCHSCNVAVGHLRDNPALCVAAAQYLDATQNAPRVSALSVVYG
jgi:hypothetical protein